MTQAGHGAVARRGRTLTSAQSEPGSGVRVSLSERLVRAEEQRSGRSTEPVPHEDRPGGGSVAVDAAAVEAGRPAPCPDCGGRGFLDRIDLGRHVQQEHCTVCGSAWSRPI